jgi:tetratricopeptide (TPR) repeat protein
MGLLRVGLTRWRLPGRLAFLSVSATASIQKAATDFDRLQSHPREVARWQKAQQQLLGDRHGAALNGYRDLVQRYPRIAQLWFELGIAAMGQLDFERADKAFWQAEQLSANDASMLVLLGQQYHRRRSLDRARACFERAAATDPGSIHAQLSLAAWCERERRLGEAWNCVEAALARQPKHTQALCAKAMLLQRQSKNGEAEHLLREIIQSNPADPNVKFSSRHLLGVVLDESGNFHEALRWLDEAKTVARGFGDTVRMQKEYDLADRRRRELLGALTPAHITRWRAEGAAFACPQRLAFLGGHPRSGTTLLEQILGVHPDILAFDESEAFVHQIWNQLAPMNATSALTVEALDKLPASRRAEMGRSYLKSLLREISGEPASPVLLDKNPSPTASLHLWLRVFPELKVIIALRDPRDIVVSCYFQNLTLTPTNANFLSLERTVKHYADLMDVWLRLRELGGFDWVETRYEDVVANLQSEGKRVTEFCGLSWHPLQANHQEAARRKILFAPTYNDVTKPIHNRAIGRWQNYADALAPFQERLKPYCEKFEYR